MRNFIITEEEKSRILEMHISATRKNYINEQNEKIVTNYDRKYDYKSSDGKFFYKLKNTENWIEAKGTGLESIKLDVFKVKGDTIPKEKTNTKEIPKQTPNNVLVSDSLIDRHINFDPTKETTPFKCSEDGCAQWVSNQLDDLGIPRQGHAWHSHNKNQKNLTFTPFMKLNPNIQDNMAKLFTKINSNPIEKSQEGDVKSLISQLTPDQTSLKNMLSVNDIVGLYWDGSNNFTKAFFEGATGISDMGKGSKETDGPYFIKKDGTPWNPTDLGKNIQFMPGKSLKNGSGFGMNTHLGYVGAIVNGEPIIFHNVHQTVHATPLSKMGKTKIFWVAKTGTGKAVSPQKTNPSWWETFKSFI
jgi:hypothetical protein